MTVSLALRDDPHVAKATKERVQRAADKLGYTPDAKLSQLMSKLAVSHTSTATLGELAFITSFDTEDDWKKQKSHIFKAYQGAQEQAKMFGYLLTPFWALSRTYRGDGLDRILSARGIEGIIIPPLGPQLIESGEIKIHLDWDQYCVVQIGSTLHNLPIQSIRHNHFEGMFLCLEHLESMGYRRIGLALSKMANLRSNHRWSAAYLQWRSLRGYRDSLPCFVFDDRIDRKRMGQWLETHQIEAVVGMDGFPLDTINELKIKVPEELGYAVLDRSDEDDYASGIDQDAKAIGAAAVDNIILGIRKGGKGIPKTPKQISVSGRWVPATTTRQTQKKAASLHKNILEEELQSEF